MSQKQKKKGKKLSDALKQCEITVPPDTTPAGTFYDKAYQPDLKKWPKPKLKVPAVFLHRPADLVQHIKYLLGSGVSMYKPSVGKNYTKISCVTFDDHKILMQYFEKKQLPYHTFGHPSKSKMKVVVRGLPGGILIPTIKAELKALKIPVIRIHKMHMKVMRKKDPPNLYLIVLPYDEDGQKILRIKKILGHEVTLEPPKFKITQCYRCQRWGHAQRYCHGAMRCVKCAGPHSYKKCDRNTNDKIKCANCGQNHTANYRLCSYYADIEKQKYKNTLRQKMKKPEPREVVTLDNYEKLCKRTVKVGEGNNLDSETD